jgi:restriction system protein
LVSEAITKVFLSPDYHLLNNLTLSSRDGTTQVDHVLVSRFGIFVIETKHYKGWIFGDANAPAWTQVIYLKKSSFQNPIRQNYKHIKSIQSLLDFLPPEHVHSAVVFTGDADFQTERPEGVFTLDGLIAHVRGFTEVVLSINRMQFCVGRLECCRFALTRETDVEHRESLNRRFGDSN